MFVCVRVSQVGRAPRAAPRNRDGLPIGEYLYASGLEALNRKELVLEAERQAERDAASKPHSTGEDDTYMCCEFTQ